MLLKILFCSCVIETTLFSLRFLIEGSISNLKWNRWFYIQTKDEYCHACFGLTQNVNFTTVYETEASSTRGGLASYIDLSKDLCSFQNLRTGVKYIKGFILLLENFLQFDWLRADVFQLKLKYLQVEVTVSMVTQNHQIISSPELRNNGGKITRFWNQEIEELKENSENQNTDKSTWTWLNVWTSWAENKNFETNLPA